MPQPSVIFDLDGTLIDSAPSILSSLKAALNEVSVTTVRPLSHSLIGPPLPQIVSEVLGKEQHARIPDVIECFKRHYDTHGYQSSVAYPGIQDLLEQLRQTNVDLYIATNKRIVPTQSILNYLGWNHYFKKVYALDCFRPAVADKSTMLSRVIQNLKRDSTELVYVGDRFEDFQAAEINLIPFLWASWGYGSRKSMGRIQTVLNSPMDLIQLTKI